MDIPALVVGSLIIACFIYNCKHQRAYWDQHVFALLIALLGVIVLLIGLGILRPAQ